MAALILFRLTLKSVWTDVPTDAAAFVTYALLLAFLGLIFLGSRTGADDHAGEEPPQQG